MYESFLAEQGFERNIVLPISHYASMSAIIERSDLISVMPRSVADIYENYLAVWMIERPVEIPPYSLMDHWHVRNQNDPQYFWLRQQVIEIFRTE